MTTNSPGMVCGDYRVKYRQVPYDNRYYKFSHRDKFGNWNEFARVVASNAELVDKLLYSLFPLEKYQKNVAYFKCRVYNYDKHLDKEG